MNSGYYYTESEYCFYIKHSDCDLVIPIYKDMGEYLINKEGMSSLIKNLNEDDNNLLSDYYKLLREKRLL